MSPGVRETLFGEIVVRAGLCTNTQIGECLDLQERLRQDGKDVPRLGELLARKRYLTPEQLQALLRGQATTGGKFGQVAVSMSLCFPADVDRALALQADQKRSGGETGRIGEILVEQGALEPHHVKAVLQAMNIRVEPCPGCGALVNLRADAPSAPCPDCGKRLGPEEETEAPGALPEAPEAAQDDVSRLAQAIEDAPAPAQAQPTAPDTRDEAARKASFGSYAIVARLGVNATGGLYLARKATGGPPVTLKIFSAEMSANAEFARNFKTAAKYGVLLKHEGINSVVDVGRDRGRLYCASEYVKGRSLRYILEKQGRLPLALAVDIARQAAAALAYAHSQGVVHGDIKPSNLIIDVAKKVRLANFGVVNNPLHNLLAISKMAGAAPIYAAPELAARDARPTVRSDVYSLGATLYHMLTGQPPHQAGSPVETLLRIAEEDLQPPSALVPDIPPNADKLVMAMLSVEPKDRHSEMTGLIEDLDTLVAAAPGTALPPAKATKPKPATTTEAAETDEPAAAQAPPPRRSRLGAVLCLLLLLACATGACAMTLMAPPTPPIPAVKPLPEASPDAPVLRSRPPQRRPIGG